ncbi:MAG TPA: tetratricopeptide repeat protein [Candidatus Krumholzibacteria bacterium]|nr:tetratricopeptide repeat protein [Candidatus Krumholzibacteria bacterium]
MRLSRQFLLVPLLILAAAPAAPAVPGHPGAPFADWSNEALFDSTTTRAELLEMGRAAVTLTQYPLAEVYYREILLRNPSDVTAMWELAAMYRRSGRLEYARGLLTRAGALQPGRNDINEARREVERDLFRQVTGEVDSLMAAGRYTSALPRLGVLLSIDGENADVLANKARCLAAIGEHDAALSNIKLAIVKDPRDEFFRLRDEYSLAVERHRIDDLEDSARRLLASGDWVREEASDVLQALLAQDPSNEWAREQFRLLSEGATPPPLPSDPPAPRQVVEAVREVAPGFAAVLDHHLPLIVAFLVVLLLFGSPLSRALAARAHRPSRFAGELSSIDVADVLRAAHGAGLSGVIRLHTAEGNAKIHFEDGEPIHCTGFGRSGLDALTYIVREVCDGRFEHRSHRGKVGHTIEQPLAVILANGVSDPGVAPTARTRKKSRMSELLETKVD